MTEKGEKTRGKILEESARVFVSKGFWATSISDILKASGVTKGNLYFHFSGKEELAMAVLAKEREDFMAFLDQALSSGTPGEALNNFFEQAYAKHQKTNFIGGCIFGNTALEASETSPLFAGLVTDVFSDWTAKIEGKIAQAQHHQEIRSDLSSAELATMIVATLEGGIMQTRLLKSEAPLRVCLQTLRTLLDMNLTPKKELN
jgi:TetR/AcrR family transcriptional repressor of nem operon